MNTFTSHHPSNLYHSFSSPTVNDEFKINGSQSSWPYKMGRDGARAMPWRHIRKWQDSTTNLNRTTRCEAGVSFTPGKVYPLQGVPGTHWKGSCVGLRQSEHYGILLPLPRKSPSFPRHPAFRPSHILTGPALIEKDFIAHESRHCC